MSSAPEYELRKYVYDYFLRTGTAPTVATVTADLKRSEASVREAFATLAAAGGLTLDRDTGEIWRAAPFCAVPTGFAVECDGARVWGTCAWDALGIPAMLHKQASIAASCACCNQPMQVSAGPAGLSGDEGVIHIAVPARDWYEDVVFTWKTMLLFRSEQHVDRWRKQWKRERGGVFSIQQGWDLAQKWYGDRTHPEWAPLSHAEAEKLFESCGLVGEFYKFGDS